MTEKKPVTDREHKQDVVVLFGILISGSIFSSYAAWSIVSPSGVREAIFYFPVMVGIAFVGLLGYAGILVLLYDLLRKVFGL